MAPLRPWVKACAAIMIIAAITLIGQAVFLATLPDSVLDGMSRARPKVDRDNELREADVRLAPGAGLNGRELMNLPSDEDIDRALDDPKVLTAQRAENRNVFFTKALTKGAGALLLVFCGVLVLRRNITVAGWVAWVLSFAGLITSVSMFANLADSRAAAAYYNNSALRIIELLALATIPIATLACAAIGWVPKQLWTASPASPPSQTT